MGEPMRNRWSGGDEMTTGGASHEVVTTGWHVSTRVDPSGRSRDDMRMAGRDEVHETVPGLGVVTWPRERRLVHASRLLLAHRPDGPALAFQWMPPFISFPARRCAACGEQWICQYVAWAKAARRQEMWREWP
jgi:hypothetical protein